MKEMSHKKEVRLGNAAPDEHVIVFYGGEMNHIICPQQPHSHSTKNLYKILTTVFFILV